MRSPGRLAALIVVTLAQAACAADIGGDPGVTPDAAPGSDAAPGTPDATPAPVDGGAYWVPGGILEQRTCPPDTFLTHDNFGSGFMSEFCVGCHSSQIPPAMRQNAPLGVDFDSLDGIRAYAGQIYLRAADGYDTMPPAGGPDPGARVLLGEWLACGMPL